MNLIAVWKFNSHEEASKCQSKIYQKYGSEGVGVCIDVIEILS